MIPDSNLPVPRPGAPAERVRSARGDPLAALPEEAVWLANFVSPRTKRTYQAAVQGFIAFHGLRSSAELRAIGQSHLIAWREHRLARSIPPAASLEGD